MEDYKGEKHLEMLHKGMIINPHRGWSAND